LALTILSPRWIPAFIAAPAGTTSATITPLDWLLSSRLAS